jgi:hypothetical protein
MFTAILIDRAPSPYLLRSYKKLYYEGKGKERSGCGTDACGVQGPMVSLQLLGE